MALKLNLIFSLSLPFRIYLNLFAGSDIDFKNQNFWTLLLEIYSAFSKFKNTHTPINYTKQPAA